jgi:hypothetical protein
LLNGAVSNRVIGRLPAADRAVAAAEFQAANRATAAVLAEEGPLLRERRCAKVSTPTPWS